MYAAHSPGYRSTDTNAPLSSFVTGLKWIFLVLGAGATAAFVAAVFAMGDLAGGHVSPAASARLFAEAVLLFSACLFGQLVAMCVWTNKVWSWLPVEERRSSRWQDSISPTQAWTLLAVPFFQMFWGGVLFSGLSEGLSRMRATFGQRSGPNWIARLGWLTAASTLVGLWPLATMLGVLTMREVERGVIGARRASETYAARGLPSSALPPGYRVPAFQPARVGFFGLLNEAAQQRPGVAVGCSLAVVMSVVPGLGLGLLHTSPRPRLPPPPPVVEVPPSVFAPLEPSVAGPPKDASALTEVRLRPRRNYNFQTRDEVVASRRLDLVAGSPFATALKVARYEPSATVLQIKDGKPWWGTLGLSVYGQGERSIDGPSDASESIENPLLLFGLTAEIVHAGYVREALYPHLTYLGFDGGSRIAWARYDVGTYFREAKARGWQEGTQRTVSLWGLNAHELDLRYFLIDSAASKGVSAPRPNVVLEDTHYIHVGQTCAYTGGCHNGAPIVNWDQVYVSDVLPAKLAIKLWRAPPSDPQAPPDVWFVLELD